MVYKCIFYINDYYAYVNAFDWEQQYGVGSNSMSLYYVYELIYKMGLC